MKAIGLKKYGEIDVLENLEVTKPPGPQGRDVLIRVKVSSVNPIDTKVRAGTYDDNPDYYDHVPLNTDKYQILSYDSSGIIEQASSDVSRFKIGDEVYFLASPFRQGTNADLVLADERAVALKPRSLSFEHAAGFPLTALTAWEALVERLEIKEGEQVAVLIINGAGGVGSIASQICAQVLRLPVIIATASREETRKEWVDEHPNYKFEIIKHRFRKVEFMNYIRRFREYIKTNGTRLEKLTEIKEFM